MSSEQRFSRFEAELQNGSAELQVALRSGDSKRRLAALANMSRILATVGECARSGEISVAELSFPVRERYRQMLLSLQLLLTKMHCIALMERERLRGQLRHQSAIRQWVLAANESVSAPLHRSGSRRDF